MLVELTKNRGKEGIIMGGGNLGKLIRSYNWSENTLGPIENWPQSLVVSVNFMLQSPVPLVMLWGVDGIMLYNDAYSLFAGQRHPFLLGSKVLEGWPEVAEFNQNVLDTVLNGGTLSYHNQKLTLFRHNVAEEVWMDLTYSAILDESGNPGGVLAIVLDITQGVNAERERQKMEVALNESREHLLALVTATSDVIYSMNADWSIMGTLQGRVFVPDKGRPRNDWFESNIPLEDQPTVRAAIEEAINTKSTFQLEHKIRRADNTIGWTSSRAIPILDTNGEIDRWIGVASDITERKRAEEILYEKNKQLGSINSDLDNFIYTASHDLKAPVSNIEGLVASLVENLESDKPSDKEENHLLLHMMQVSIAKFKNTINELTEISKIQKLQNEDIEDVNISEILEDVKLSIHDKIQEAKAHITSRLSDVPILKYSKKNIRSILYNLISNAVKYRDPSRQAEIWVELSKKQEWVVLEVSDNGLGIKEEDQKKVFSIYKRFHNHVEGTGIGLYIVKKMVDNAGGHVEVKSELGKGTMFLVYFKA